MTIKGGGRWVWRLMEKNILNFHFGYLHPSLSDWPWWDLIDATLIVEVDVETDADFAVADSLHCFWQLQVFVATNLASARP